MTQTLRFKCEKYVCLYWFSTALRRILNSFFQLQGQTLHEGHAQYNTLRDVHLTVSLAHTFTNTQMEALKLAHSEVTVCIAGPNMPLHSDHRVSAGLKCSRSHCECVLSFEMPADQ